MDSSDLDDFDTDEGEIDDEEDLLPDHQQHQHTTVHRVSNSSKTGASGYDPRGSYADDRCDDNSDSDELRGLVGLQNLGNTCYINAALQALSNCPQLTRFVLNHRPASNSTNSSNSLIGNGKNTGLSRCYSELIHELWSNTRMVQYAVPSSIIRNIKCIYPAFRGCTQQDTQEFLRCFLEQLHDELKQPVIKQKYPATKQQQQQQKQQQQKKMPMTMLNSSSSSISSLAPSITSSHDEAGDIYTRENGHKEEKEEEEEEEEGEEEEDVKVMDSSAKVSATADNNHSSDSQNKQQQQLIPQRSIISDTFEFRISSSIVCSSCKNISTTKETFKDLSVPIPCRDHPYYQQTSDSNDSLHLTGSMLSSAKQQHNSNQMSSFSNSKNDYGNGPLENHHTNETLTSSSSSKADNFKENSTNDAVDKEATRSNEDSGSDIDSSEDSSSCRELATTSYLDSIPLAKWFISWFSRLGSWFWGPQVTLYDCLSVFFGTDPLEGDNEYSCEICTKKNRGVKFLKILELPEVLCIHFKRYESVGSAKITTHVSFPLTGLDLAPFMSPESSQQGQQKQSTNYNLIACICHHGSALLTGHYTTYALNCYDDQWYEFDDQYVTNVSSYQVENSEAYILFYQKAPTPPAETSTTSSSSCSSSSPSPSPSTSPVSSSSTQDDD